MKKILKKFLWGTGILLSLILLAVIISAIIIFTQKNLIKNIAQKYINKNFDIPVQIGKLNYSFFPLSFEIENISFPYNIGETEIKIKLEKISGRGDLYRLRQNRRPYLDTLLIEGLKIDAQIRRTGKVIYWHELALNLSRGLSFIRCLDLENSFIKLRLADFEVLIDEVNFSLSPEEKEGDYIFLLQAAELSASSGQALSGNSEKLNISGLLELSQTPTLSSSLSLAGINLYFEDKPLRPDNSIEGRIRLFLPVEKNILSIRIQELSLPQNIYLTGEAEADFDKPFYSFSPRIHLKDIGQWLALLEPYLPQSDIDWDKLNISGSTILKGKGFVDGKENRFLFDGNLNLGPLDLKYEIPGINTKAQLAADLNITAGPEKKEVEGLFTLAGGCLQTNDVSLSSLEVKIPVSYAEEELTLKGITFTGTLEETVYAFRENKINLPPITFKGEAGFNFPSMSTELHSFILSFPSLPSLTIKGKAYKGIQGEKNFSFSWTGIKLQEILQSFPEIIPENFLSWEMEGQFGLEGRLKQKGAIEKNPWETEISLDISDVTLHNPDFTIASEALSSRVNFCSELSFPLKTILFSLDFKLKKGESLWKTYYLNWGKYNLETTVEGTIFPLEKKIQDLSFKLSLGELAEFSAAGSLSYENKGSMNMETDITLFDPAGLQEILTGGDISYDLQGIIKTKAHIQGLKNGLEVKGLLQLDNFSLKDEKKGFSIQKIEAAVPFKIPLSNDSSSMDTGEENSGFILIDDLVLPAFFLDSLRLDIQAKPGRFIIKPASLKLGDGKLTLGETSLNYFPEFKLSSSLFLEKTEISSLLPNLELPLKGTVQAGFSPVFMNRDQLKTDGSVEINIFEGKVKIDEIEVKNPFSKNRTFLSDITFREINLEKMTGLVPFGRVTGIVNGEIRDLAVSYGQPERFSLLIESEKKEGISQLFSLKAADDISVIGTGTKTTFSSSSWLTKFVEDFRYQKIGISCSLKNDVFTLNGTIKEKGVEYLVKGPWLFGINVVNKIPRNTIRFKDMLDRLKRIGRTQ